MSLQHGKRLGEYLIEAGLLSEDQVQVALEDQRLTGMRLGDIIVAPGWVREKTIEYLMKKVIARDKAESPADDAPPLPPPDHGVQTTEGGGDELDLEEEEMPAVGDTLLLNLLPKLKTPPPPPPRTPQPIDKSQQDTLILDWPPSRPN